MQAQVPAQVPAGAGAGAGASGISAHSDSDGADGARAGGAREALLPPPLAQRVRLLLSAHELCVEMDFAPAGAHEASDEEVTQSGPVLERVAAGVAWLAERRLLYTDVRGPNVLVAARGGSAAADDGCKVLIVDYDDCAVLWGPVSSAAEYRTALATTGAVAAGRDCFAARFASGDFPDVEAALDRAFAASAALCASGDDAPSLP